MGCLKSIAYQIGCLVVGLALLVLGFIYREQVVAIYHKLRGTQPHSDIVYAGPGPNSRQEARRLLDRLDQRGGPAWVDLEAHHVAALVEEALGGGLDSIQVGLAENDVRVRGSLDLRSVPRDILGPLRGVVGDREPVVIGGGFDADSAGRLRVNVTTLSIANFPFPRATIPRLLREARVRGLEGARLELPGIRDVGDVRVTPSHVRLYRSSPR